MVCHEKKGSIGYLQLQGDIYLMYNDVFYSKEVQDMYMYSSSK
jgi:hypothetical protein